MFYIRKREKLPMSYLIQKGLNALENSKEHKDIVQRFNMKETNKNLKTPDIVILEQLAERAEASTDSQQLSRTLASIFKLYGPEALVNSPKIAQRIYNTINRFPANEEAEDKAAEDEQIVETEYQTRIVPALKNKLKSFIHSDGSQLYEDDAIEALLAERGRVVFKNNKLYIDGNEVFSLE
jgi:hypothetical protein